LVRGEVREEYGGIRKGSMDFEESLFFIQGFDERRFWGELGGLV
jgi:hypothetical protein